MTHEPRTIDVEPGSELPRLLAEVSDESVELRSNGVRYRLNRLASPSITDEMLANYDPERGRAGLRAVAGLLNDDEAEEMVNNISLSRQMGSRPLDRE